MACGEGGVGGGWLPRHGEYWPWTFCPADVMSRGARSGDVYNKSDIFINLIVTDKPYICTIIETWNDSAECSNLAASTSPTMVASCGPVCGEWLKLPTWTFASHTCMAMYSDRAVSLLVYMTFEILDANEHGAGLNLFWP